jgi:hypothetical protein
VSKSVFRTCAGELLTSSNRRGLEAAKTLMRIGKRERAEPERLPEAVEAMTAHSFLPPAEAAKLERARNRAAEAQSRSTSLILNSAADRVTLGPDLIATIKARSAK